TVQSSSGLDSNCGTGLSRLPARLRGAARSSAVWIAGSAITAGVTITDFRVAGVNGWISTSAGRRSLGPGQSKSKAQSAAPNETMAIRRPIAILPHGRGMQATSSESRSTPQFRHRSWCQQGGGITVVSAPLSDDGLLFSLAIYIDQRSGTSHRGADAPRTR